MAEKKYVYICYGWSDYVGGKNYIAYADKINAMNWVQDSKKLARIDNENVKDKYAIAVRFEEMHSEHCDNYKYIKMEIV